MNTKPLSLLLLTFTLAACGTGATASPRPTGTPAAPSPTAPTPTAPATPGPATPAPTPLPSPSTPPAGSGQTTDITGRSFVGATVTVGGQPLALVPGTNIRINFDGSQVGASAGCNTFGGPYHLDGATLTVDGGSMTEMGCDGPRHAQDDWLFGFLDDDPTIALNGATLVLTSADGGTVITLTDTETAEPDQALVGRTWTLNSMIAGDMASSVPAGVTASIMFKADGRVDVQFGCNDGGGNYTVDGDKIHISELATTLMLCQQPNMSVELAMTQVLQSMELTYEIDANALTLSAGPLALQFLAA
jgi:heat shock protein HslJ